MGGRLSRRRSRRQKQCQTDVTPGASPRAIDSEDLAEVDGHVIDLRSDTSAQIETMARRLDRVEAVVDDLHALSLAMARACEHIRR